MQQTRSLARFVRTSLTALQNRRNLPMASEDFGCFGAEWHDPAVIGFLVATIRRCTPRRKRKEHSVSFQPTKSALCTSDSSNYGDGCKSPGCCGACVAGGVNDVLIHGHQLAGPFRMRWVFLEHLFSHSAVRQRVSKAGSICSV